MMEKVLGASTKIVVDADNNQNLMYLPIEKLMTNATNRNDYAAN